MDKHTYLYRIFSKPSFCTDYGFVFTEKTTVKIYLLRFTLLNEFVVFAMDISLSRVQIRQRNENLNDSLFFYGLNHFHCFGGHGLSPLIRYYSTTVPNRHSRVVSSNYLRTVEVKTATVYWLICE